MEQLRYWRRLTRYDKILILIFLISLPLVNPWVRGDGVGYYAYARALVVNGNLRFEPDWLHANTSFRIGHVNSSGEIRSELYLPTGYLDNHFTIGPALDWMPFLFLTHAAVRGFDRLGGRIPADGFSWPYRYTMAVVTALAGFLGLVFSFSLARKYFPERWAFLATLGIWFASSLPVYMYFNPSWSHAHSAFAVALFVWYWERTRGTRSWCQWAVLGAVGGLMMDVYYVNATLLLLPLLESLVGYVAALRAGARQTAGLLLASNMAFAAALLIAFSPTLITKRIIYGSFFYFGYTERWFWKSPALLKVCFSSDHGLFSWTPIIALAVAGLVLLRRYDRTLSVYCLAVFLAFLYTIGCYENWHGISSYGSRFFISLTPIFVLSLAALFDAFEKTWHESLKAWLPACAMTGILVLWNAGFIFQWGMHLIPDRGNIYWGQMVDNQFRVVPRELAGSLERYFTRRSEMMQSIEKRDLRQLRGQQGKPDGEKSGE